MIPACSHRKYGKLSTRVVRVQANIVKKPANDKICGPAAGFAASLPE